MENSELFGMIEKLPPDSKKEVEDLTLSLAGETNEIPTGRGFGGMKGFITYMADDFDAPLKEFHDYMYHISIEFIEKIEKLPIEMQDEIESLVDEMLKKIKTDLFVK